MACDPSASEQGAASDAAYMGKIGSGGRACFHTEFCAAILGRAAELERWNKGRQNASSGQSTVDRTSLCAGKSGHD